MLLRLALATREASAHSVRRCFEIWREGPPSVAVRASEGALCVRQRANWSAWTSSARALSVGLTHESQTR